MAKNKTDCICDVYLKTRSGFEELPEPEDLVKGACGRCEACIKGRECIKTHIGNYSNWWKKNISLVEDTNERF